MSNKDEFVFPDEQEISKPNTAAAKGKETDDDFEVEVVDDTPAADQNRRPLDREVADPTDDELATYSEKVQARIKELTHSKHDERREKEKLLRERAELERVARAAMEENRKLRGYVDNGSKQFVEQAQTLAESKVEKAKKALKEAQDLFDTDAIVQAQSDLFDAKIEAADAKKFRPTALQEQEDDVQMRTSASQEQQVDERTAQWQSKNRWFMAPGYEEVTSFALGLHQKLVNSGVDPQSDAYFERIDSRLKATFPEIYGETERQPAARAPTRPASVVAPATRSSGTRKVQLTATQVALAAKFGLTPQQYAAEVAKMEA